MYHIAMDPHLAESGGYSNRFMRDHPDLSGKAIHLHGEPHSRVHGSNSSLFECGDYISSNLVHLITCVVKLEIRYRARRAANWFTIHSTYKTHKRLGIGKESQYILPFVCYLRPINLNEAYI